MNSQMAKLVLALAVIASIRRPWRIRATDIGET